MHSLLDFLTAAPKSYVMKLHRKQEPDAGLMQAAKVTQLVHDWALDSDRIAKVIQSIDKQGRFLLALIYVAEERGATETELLNSLEGFPPSQVMMLLGKLELELLIFCRDADKVRNYQGFQEMAQRVLPTVLGERLVNGPGVETANWFSYKHFLTSHLIHFLCQISLGAIKVTQSGEMHRKDQQELAQRFSFGEKLSSVLPTEEVQFLLHFAVSADLILQEDGVLHLSPEGKALLADSRDGAYNTLLNWWQKTRTHGMTQTLEAMKVIAESNPSASTSPNDPALHASRIAPWANLFWIYSSPQRKGYQDDKGVFTWENLPKILQELWLLGLVDFGMVKGRIAWMRPAALLETEIKASSSNPISLPNLETLVPLDSPLNWLHRLEMVGLKSNDEFMVRYHFSKESVIGGLQNGLGMEAFTDLLGWLGFEAHARRTLLDWASTYASTLFMDTLLLKVSDPVRFRELAEIPQFMELVTEVIPNYGFLLHRHNKARVKELLHHFGLVPGEDSRRILNLDRVVLSSIGPNWELTFPEIGVAAYRENPGSMRAPANLPQDKSSIATREHELALRIETLENAIAGEKFVEFSYPMPLPTRVTIRPLLLLKHRDPMKVIGIEKITGHRNEYVLENVKAARILD